MLINFTCKINAHLINIYFTNATDWPDYATKHGFECSEIIIQKLLGIPKRHKLTKYIHSIYIDTNELSQK